MPLIIKGRVIPLSSSDPNRTFAGRVFLNDVGAIELDRCAHVSSEHRLAGVGVGESGDAGNGNHNLIFTSALTEQPLQLARTAQRMEQGAGFIYHCSAGQQGSVVVLTP